MQGSTAVKFIAVMAALICISAFALMVYRSNGAALNWQTGDDDPIQKFYPYGGDLYLIGASNVSMVDTSGNVLWRKAFPNAQYSVLGSNGTLYVYSTDAGLNTVYPNGTISLLTHQGMNHPPLVGSDGTIYLRSWSLLTAIDSSGKEKWNASSVVSDPVIDRSGNIYFFQRPPEHLSDVYLYCMAPDGTVRWSQLFDKYYASTALKPAMTDGIFVYDEPSGILYHVDSNGYTNWDHSMTYLGQYKLFEDEKNRLYLSYTWGTVHVLDEHGNLISKFNPVITYNANLSYTLSAYNDTIYVVGDDKSPDSEVVYALDMYGSLKWKRQINSSTAPTIYPGEHVICVDTEYRSGSHLVPTLYVIDENGDIKFTYKSGDGRRWEQVYISHDDTVYAKTYGGKLYALRG